ncbi:MAG: iron ABC transporter permease [Spirochaetales bacterium]|nr:iron ABC transporter permease [Spirochaetales bacterium]
MKQFRGPSFTGALTGLSALLLLLMVLSVLLGRYPQTGFTPLRSLLEDALALRLVLTLRLPRVLTAVLLGAALASAGNAFQMIFGNPMVEPGFLGVSQGAAFGAGFCIVFITGALWAVQLSAALFAILGLGFSYYLARKIRFGGWVLRLILAGIAVSAVFSAGIGIIKFAADPMTQLPEITFWLLGGLHSVQWRDVYYAAPIVVAACTILVLLRWRINVLSLSEETAYSLGTRPGTERFLVLTIAAVATAAVVSVAGIISWVGLIVPHLTRRLFRADGRYSVPASMVLGGIFTLICDDAARLLFPGELPLGVITSLLGAVLFIVVLALKQVRVKA